MSVIIDILLLLAGFVLLIKGADFFVEGAASLARRLRIPSLVVGLTIVAIGTSAPELAVSISASLGGQNSMAVSNVIGSNVFNLLGVLGVCALIIPLGVTRDILRRDYPVSIAVSVLFFLMLLFVGAAGEITLWEALLLIALLIGYVCWTVMSALKNRSAADEAAPVKFVWWKCAVFIVAGVAGIVFGGNLVVDHASALGSAIGMSDSLVGLTICAVGTSLPELVTSVAACRKGENDMAIGNVVGSNILNVLCILGVSGAISPITVSGADLGNTLVDFGVYVVVCVLTYVFCLTQKRITRAEGGVLVGMYLLYMAYAIVRDAVGGEPFTVLLGA
ncbi:MAG: calcium/sodium antiporter [Oscillospiraceae bacterium]|nr:calcium/sodium antiporter [Oscillospiraceae bacterium]